MDNGLNHVEPNRLVDAFLKHPPQDFQASTLDNSLYYFVTNFNLLTTLDAPVRQKIESLVGYHYWKKIVHFPTRFIGTTVTEYTPIPQDTSSETLIDTIKKNSHEHSLTIIKDLPLSSPLLTQEENQASAALIGSAKEAGFLAVEGQALAYVEIDFNDREDYLSRLSKSRRKNLKRKLRSLDELNVEIHQTGDHYFNHTERLEQLYTLYLAVYEQSEIHFDLLSKAFFQEILQDSQSGGRVFMYWKGETLIGYNICYVYEDKLVDKYIGLNYPLALDYNLYFISWFVNLDYAKSQHLKYYVAGWTDPEVKAQLGAKFTFTQHLVWVKSPLLRFILKRFRHLFEADAHWHQQQEEKTVK